ncbi:MAG: histidinol-phosphate transaminase [Litoreibacter sp.]|nr:histidinol-phosphate transaminase [Litoreibacter sp.]
MTITPQPGILDIALYQGGEAHAPGVVDPVKLSSNENPFGPSPRALDAFRQAAGNLHVYPSTDHAALRAAIGEVQGLDPERIICGVGSDEIISFLCYAYAGPGDEVLHTEHGFAMYRISALAAGATPVVAPEDNRKTDVDALLEACTERTRLVFIANPNNPTGTMISQADLERLADGLPEQALLVLDGAYAEYVEDYDAGQSVIDTRENVFMTRTFSKIYGLGGLRVGWGYGPQQIVDTLNRIRGPFNLSSPALQAAEVAMRDVAYTDRCRIENTRMRTWLSKALENLGVPSDPSFCNFILARFADPAEAEACDAHLKSRGLIVRRVGGYGLPECLRITIGDATACKRVAAEVAAFKGQVR